MSDKRICPVDKTECIGAEETQGAMRCYRCRKVQDVLNKQIRADFDRTGGDTGGCKKDQ